MGKTREDTVLAFSNDEAFAVLISRKTKQECVRKLRAKGLSSDVIYFRLFAAHTVALATFRGERMADLVLTVEEILGEF
jgi:hypothetical protein